MQKKKVAAPKAKKAAVKNKAAMAKTKKLVRTSLVALASANSAPADLNVVFRSGIGQLTASLYRKGLLINMQSISNSGNIHFSEVQKGDVAAINGVCTGSATITINIITIPATPEQFSAGVIIAAYLFN